MHEMIEPGTSPGWDDLFADLGLPTETPAAPAPAAPESSAAEQESKEKDEAPPARGRRRRSPAVAAEEEPAVAEAMEQPAPLAIESTEVSVPAEELTSEAGTAESSAVEGGEEAPAPKGRSRRRRRGRGSKSAAPAVEASPDVPASEGPTAEIEAPAGETTESITPGTESDEESGRRPRRRRSRGRNPEPEDAPQVAVNTNADVSDDAEEEELEPANREEEVDDLSNWNVPTWGELIGSLYRPER
jgi:ribonuclease E